MARGRGQHIRSTGEDSSGEVQVCPLCIEPLDADEQQFYPCPCGYQVCVFCHKKIELFCNNLCPGCRTEYGSQKEPFDPASRQSSNDVAHPAASMPSTPAKHTLTQSADASTPQSQLPGIKGNGLQAGWPPLWGPSADRSGSSVSAASASQSPINGASAWPSLAASQRQIQSSHPPTSSQLPQHQTEQFTSAWQSHQSDQQQEETAASSAIEDVRVTLPAPLTASQVPSVQADPDGAALLQKVQSAVGSGELSIEEGTKQLVAFLRQREQTNNGKSGAHVPKPPPGFATAASLASAGKPQLPSQLPDSGLASQSDRSTILSPFPAMQPCSSSTQSQAANLLSSAQLQPGIEAPGARGDPQWGGVNAASGLHQWGYPQAADNLSPSQLLVNNNSTMPPVSSTLRSTAGMFPVDLVAASAALWAAPATGANQLQSLSSLGFSQPLVPRKRRGPLYARTGHAPGKGSPDLASQTSLFGVSAEGKTAQQQTQWQTLGNGIFGDHLAGSPQSRNGFSTNSSMFAGVQSHQDADGQQLQTQEYTNGLPANGSLFSQSGS